MSSASFETRAAALNYAESIGQKWPWIKGNKTPDTAARGEAYHLVREDGTADESSMMTQDEFTAIRPGHIGGSAIAAVCGHGAFDCRRKAFDKFLGIDAEPPANGEILQLGHVFEGPVLEVASMYFKKYMGLDAEIINDNRIYQNSAYPLAQCNLDGRVVRLGGKPCDAVFEAKNTGNPEYIRMAKQGQICPQYFYQVQMYMLVLGVSTAYVGMLWGNSLDAFALIKVDADPGVQAEIAANMDDFRNCAEQGLIPAETSDNPDLVNKYEIERNGVPEKGKSVETDDPAILNAARAWASLDREEQELMARVKELQEKKASCLTAVLERGQNAETISVSEDGTDEDGKPIRTVYYINEKQPYHRASFDENRFRAEHPDIAAKFEKKSLDVTRLKKEVVEFDGKKLTAPYIIPPAPNEKELPTLSVNVRVYPRREDGGSSSS